MRTWSRSCGILFDFAQTYRTCFCFFFKRKSDCHTKHYQGQDNNPDHPVPQEQEQHELLLKRTNSRIASQCHQVTTSFNAKHL